MDSSLVACRVHRELGMCTLPHMTCRDRNLNATKALLLGLYAEGVREVLAIAGDALPTAVRDEVGLLGLVWVAVVWGLGVVFVGLVRVVLGCRARILAGIMPVVSQRNAIFMENEINGIHVEEDIIRQFAGLDRAQGEELGLAISLKMAREALPYADGFYLMTPFNRVALMERLIARLKVEVLE